MDPEYPTPLYINPADYFKGSKGKVETAYTQPIIYGASLTMGLVSNAVYNILNKRPVVSGLHLYGFTIVGSCLVAKFILDYRRNRHAERDAVIRHYIELHPEDFPPIERKKYRDVFQPWIPIR